MDRETDIVTAEREIINDARKCSISDKISNYSSLLVLPLKKCLNLLFCSEYLNILLWSWKVIINPTFCIFFLMQFIGKYDPIIRNDNCQQRVVADIHIGWQRFLDPYYIVMFFSPVVLSLFSLFIKWRCEVEKVRHIEKEWIQFTDCFETVTFILLLSMYFPDVSTIVVVFLSCFSILPIFFKRVYPHWNYPASLVEVLFSILSSGSAVATCAGFINNLLSIVWPRLSNSTYSEPVVRYSFIIWSSIASFIGLTCMAGSFLCCHENNKLIEKAYHIMVFSVENTLNILFQIMAAISSLAYCATKGETHSLGFLIPLCLSFFTASILVYRHLAENENENVFTQLRIENTGNTETIDNIAIVENPQYLHGYNDWSTTFNNLKRGCHTVCDNLSFGCYSVLNWFRTCHTASTPELEKRLV